MTIEHTQVRLAAAAAQSRWEEYARRRANVSTELALLEPGPDATSESAAGDADLQAHIEHLERELTAAENTLAMAQAELDATNAALDDALAAAPRLWPEATPAGPIALFPLRLEARFRAAGAAAELLVRAYPDEIHVDAFDPRLSARELELATAYWSDVTSSPDRRAAAWQILLAQLSPTRAAWAVEQLRPPAGPSPPSTRADREVRVVTSPLLPERLVFSGYRDGALAWRVVGRVLPADLALGPDPAAIGPDAEDPDGDRLPWTGLSRWLIDFDEAVRLGMAVRVALPEGPLALDLLTVVGVAVADPATGAERCAAALRAHYYTKGLGFLAPGTPTNNTPASRSGWSSRPAPLAPEEVDRRRAAFEPAGPSDAARLTRALGIDGRPVLAVLDGQSPDETEELPQALQLVADSTRLTGSAAASVAAGQPLVDHFRAHVRARGPLPTIRVSRQPYGILPATSLALWKGDEVPGLVVAALRTLIAHAVTEPVGARIADAPDQDAAFVDVLTRVPRSSRAWRSTVSNRLGDRGVGPSLFGWIPDGNVARWLSAGPPDETQGLAVVDDVPVALQQLLTGDGFTGLSGLMGLAEDAGEAAPPDGEPDLTAFFTAFDESFGHLQNPFEIFQDLGPGTGIYVALAISFAFFLIPAAAGFVVARNQAEAAGDAELAARLAGLLDVLRGLAATIAALQPAAAQDLPHLDGLLAEAIDAASHRIDAWMTSLATARLSSLRAGDPGGIRLGAYGWLEDLSPRSPGQRTAPDGWVLAPSPHHAVTAAVLRSGWLAHEDRTAFAVDLSSARVRRARAMLEGVANGQTISMLLGYQLERGLHEDDLDYLIPEYRRTFPLATGADPARAVADGEAVRQARAWIAAQGPDVTTLLPISQDATKLTALLSIIADLDDTVDAVGDLLLAEGVHQLVGGSAERAAVSVDAIARGEKPPLDPDVVRTPRRGTAVACRVAAVLPPRPPHGWSQNRKRALLAPEAEAWASALLGPAAGWAATVEVAGAPLVVTLAELDLAALDVVAEATEPVQTSPLAARVAAQAAAAHDTPAEEVSVGAEHLDELATLCGHARFILASAQPLLPGAFSDDPQQGWDVADLESIAGRLASWAADARDAAARLHSAAAALRDGATDTAQAVAAAHDLAELGVMAAIGFEATGDPANAGLALAARVQAAAIDPGPVPTEAPARSQWHAQAVAAARDLLGNWLTLPPRWPSAAGGDALAGRRQPAGVDEDQIRDWLAARRSVRPTIAALDDLLTCGEIIGAAGAARLTVAQDPFTPGSEWVGNRPPRGQATATIVFADSQRANDDAVAGLLIDDWVEVVPAGPDRNGRPAETVAAAFNVERPDAQAPQAVLLAVPPDPTRPWVEEDLHAIVEETFALSRIRTLDAVDLPELRWTIPW